MFIHHLTYAIIFGLLTVIIGYSSKLLVHPFLDISLPDVCSRWNENHVMELSLFITGFLLYIVVCIGRKYIMKKEEHFQQGMISEDMLLPKKMENEDVYGPQVIELIKKQFGEDRLYDLYEQVEAHLQLVPEKQTCIMTEQMKDKLVNDKRLGNYDIVKRLGGPRLRIAISWIVNNTKPGIVGRDCRLTTRPQRPDQEYST